MYGQGQPNQVMPVNYGYDPNYADQSNVGFMQPGMQPGMQVMQPGMQVMQPGMMAMPVMQIGVAVVLILNLFTTNLFCLIG